MEFGVHLLLSLAFWQKWTWFDFCLWSELHHELVQDSREPVFLNQIESNSVPPFMTTAFNIIQMTTFLAIFHNLAVLDSLSILNNATHFPLYILH